jgi:hypothetical protein
MSVPKEDRERALRAVALCCISQAQGIELEQHIIENLGFGSTEAMRIQLGNWDVPSWITQGEPAAEKPKAPKSPPRERKARSSGPVTELPPANAAAPLFREKLRALIRATEDLEHRKEKLQGKRFIQSAVYRDPVYVSRDSVSDDQWRYIRDLFGLDSEAKGYMHFGGASFSLGGGTPAPEAPLPELIGAYLLAGGDLEPLVEALHPDPASAEWDQMKKRIEGRKGDKKYKQDGIKALAEQLAKAIRGGTFRSGSPVAELSPREINVASRITELREQGWSDEDIYQKLCNSKGFAQELSSRENLSPWENFERLANLELRYPFS